MPVSIKEINIKINIKRDIVPQDQLTKNALKELSLDDFSKEFLDQLIHKCKNEVQRENKSINNLKINF
ncbi:hypothetical protein [Flammeovirga kamogawensis]|uniref:Uncharacterized protein n=1 Tax=Flammeovirga kamogawensis TaxID=373891 RepID=A0ABX8GXU9_9BACT|nr:hypothetical protein [Flammeovirga kamogawensis]MBB6458862.1 hypothetical protein [Flammeovirga kamogawensis]QWG08443.1 hypothetical protein KM029_05770 [Flammeovirga kamogawensis]TRX66740.1 hypothetical protein EO216_00830 [Flammeovirga kamogawensis]